MIKYFNLPLEVIYWGKLIAYAWRLRPLSGEGSFFVLHLLSGMCR